MQFLVGGDRTARVPPEHNRQLFTGDGIIGSKRTVSIAAHSALTGNPADSLGVPPHLITSYFKMTYELLKSAL